MKNLATLQITSINGVPLTAIHIPAGAWAGYPAAVSKQAQVEFYDTRYNHTVFGQFTGGRYNVRTIVEDENDGRWIIPDGDVRDWMVGPAELNRVKAWLKGF